MICLKDELKNNIVSVFRIKQLRNIEIMQKGVDNFV
jgi:hypothetical protein